MQKAKLLPGFMLSLLFASTLSAFLAPQVHAQKPEIGVFNPLTGDSNFLFSTSTVSVGFKFNATLNINSGTEVSAWQVRMNYNATVLTATRAWIAPATDPAYIFFGLGPAAIRPPPSLTSGSVLIGDSLIPTPTYVTFTTPKKLGTIEFQILIAPPAGGKAISPLDIGNAETYIAQSTLMEIPSTKTSGNYELTAEAPLVNKPPVALFTFTPTLQPKVGDVVTFDASGSSDPDGTIVSYQWSFGDGSGETSKIVTHAYAAAGTFTVTLTAADNAGAIAIATMSITIASAPPPPPGVQVEVNLYPEFSSGQYPEWKNFTVNNIGLDNIVKIIVTFPSTTPAFRPNEYQILTSPGTPEFGWIVHYNPLDRTVEFVSSDFSRYYISPEGRAVASIKFAEGPADPTQEYGFMVTVTVSDGHAYTFYPTEKIDKLPPNAEITFPGPESLQPDGTGYAFVKKSGGDIWVQMPNSTVKNIHWLWINGTANDPTGPSNPFCSGIDRVEIWVWFSPAAFDMERSPIDSKTRYPNGLWTCMGDAVLSAPSAQEVSWWWKTDPTKVPSIRANGTNVWVIWTPELWYQVKARAFDRSVNDDKRYLIDQSIFRRDVLLANWKDTSPHHFFWFTETRIGIEYNHQPIEWAPGNGRVDINGSAGFYPNGDVTIYIINRFYLINLTLTTLKADNNGRFYAVIPNLPELPRLPFSGFSQDNLYNITAVDIRGNRASDIFFLIPWITYDDPSTTRTTMRGNFNDTITVYGHGFLPSRNPVWDPFSTVYVNVVYTDIAPFQDWTSRSIWNGTSEVAVDNLIWEPRLSEVVLARVATDANGHWSASVRVPQSYGGLHAIYAMEDPRGRGSIDVVGLRTRYTLVRSGWPEFTDLQEEQAVIFDMMSYRSALIDIDPKSLNLVSKGNWITAYIELGKSFDMQKVNVSSIMLNGTIPVGAYAPVAIGDYDKDGIPDLMVKFSRSAVTSYIHNQGIRHGRVTLMITGKLKDGTPFEGNDVIKVIFPDLNNGQKSRHLRPRHCHQLLKGDGEWEY